MNKRNKAREQVFRNNSHFGKWAILGPKNAHPHNFGSTGKTFFKFCTMKGANR